MIRDNIGNVVPREDWDITDYQQQYESLVAQVARLQSAIRHHVEHRSVDMKHRHDLRFAEYKDCEQALLSGAGLHEGDMDRIVDPSLAARESRVNC